GAIGAESWECGEIVSIYHDSPLPKGKKRPAPSSPPPPLFIEIRWFYDPNDVKLRASASLAPPPQTLPLHGSLYPLLYETDHVDTVPAESLVSPLTLSPTPSSPPSVPQFLPAPYFYSMRRQSLMPVTDDAPSRTRRGRLYATTLQDPAVKAALTAPPLPGTSAPTPATGAGRLNSAISLLSLSAANTTTSSSHLAERTTERASIENFLTAAVKSRGSATSALFIAGPPGSGKTASVNHVLRGLNAQRAAAKLPDFKVVYLNGMELRHPYEAYTRLLEGIGGEEQRQPGAAAAVLERHFSTKPPAAAGGSKKATPADGRTVTVLVLDEMDYLVTAKQTVLYNLFDWPTRNSLHGLVVIGIANTINLPERLLPRVQSRLGLLRLTFKAYTVEQMVSILKTRLSESDASGCFENGALEFAARKTVGLSGDVRRAFQVCQEAAKSVMEAAETASTEAGAPPPKTTVTVRAVVNAVKAMTDVPQLQSIRSCTDLEALLIVSLAAMLASTGREEGGIGVAELRTKMSGSAAALGDQKYLPIPSWNELLMMLNRLDESRILILETPKTASMRTAAAGSAGVWPLIKLNVDVFDIKDVLMSSDHSKLAEKFLASNMMM
ncbi:hypothetical protein TeGR_g10283, partial [Tetraparma gracilis]